MLPDLHSWSPCPPSAVFLRANAQAAAGSVGCDREARRPTVVLVPRPPQHPGETWPGWPRAALSLASRAYRRPWRTPVHTGARSRGRLCPRDARIVVTYELAPV